MPTPDASTDEPIVNDRLLHELYGQHRTAFFRWAQHRYPALDTAALADVFQDAMLILYENMLNGKFRQESGLRTYLFAIGKNLLNRSLEKNRRLPATDLPDGLSNQLPDESALFFEVESNDRQQNIADLLDSMGEPCKTLLHLFYFYSQSLKNIAQRMDYSSTDVVKTQKGRCLRRLKGLFEQAAT